jgi:hypothetical protein
MNAEKELLLALLIEKYASKTTITVQIPKASRNITRRRSQKGRRHEWTTREKSYLVQARAEGDSWEMIAKDLGLNSKQIQSMHYTLTKRKEISA